MVCACEAAVSSGWLGLDICCGLTAHYGQRAQCAGVQTTSNHRSATAYAQNTAEATQAACAALTVAARGSCAMAAIIQLACTALCSGCSIVASADGRPSALGFTRASSCASMHLSTHETSRKSRRGGGGCEEEGGEGWVHVR